MRNIVFTLGENLYKFHHHISIIITSQHILYFNILYLYHTLIIFILYTYYIHILYTYISTYYIYILYNIIHISYSYILLINK